MRETNDEERDVVARLIRSIDELPTLPPTPQRAAVAIAAGRRIRRRRLALAAVVYVALGVAMWALLGRIGLGA